jgi:ribose transport system substrate-binding protein
MRGKNIIKFLSVLLVIMVFANIVVGCGQSSQTNQVSETSQSDGNDESAVNLDPEAALEWYLKQPEPVPKKKYQLGFAAVYLADPIWVAFEYGVEQQCEKLGLPKPYVTSAGGYDKAAEQIAQVEDLLARGIDGLLLGPADPDGLVPTVERAVEAGVPVLNFASGINTDKVISDIQVNQRLIGQRAAERLGKELNGKGKVFMLAGVAGTSWALEREKGFIEYMKEHYPDIQIVGKQYSKNDRAVGLRIAEDALQAHPDIDAFYGGSDLLAAGAADAVKAAGKKGKIKVISLSGISKDTQQLIRNGEITFSVPYQAVEQGKMLVNVMVHYLNGDKNIPKRIGLPIEIIDQKNVDTFDISKFLAPDGYKPSLAQ